MSSISNVYDSPVASNDPRILTAPSRDCCAVLVYTTDNNAPTFLAHPTQNSYQHHLSSPQCRNCVRSKHYHMSQHYHMGGRHILPYGSHPMIHASATHSFNPMWMALSNHSGYSLPASSGLHELPAHFPTESPTRPSTHPSHEHSAPAPKPATSRFFRKMRRLFKSTVPKKQQTGRSDFRLEHGAAASAPDKSTAGQGAVSKTMNIHWTTFNAQANFAQ